MPNLERWRATWAGLGVAGPGDTAYAELIACYSEPHRHYHTTQHLEECFVRVDEGRALAERVFEVELAIWYHDLVYDTRRSDNEEQSASRAHAVVGQSGLPVAVADRVSELVLVTKHEATSQNPDAALLTDVDLAILGAPADRFDEYERQDTSGVRVGAGFLVSPQASRDPGSVSVAAVHLRHAALPRSLGRTGEGEPERSIGRLSG